MLQRALASFLVISSPKALENAAEYAASPQFASCNAALQLCVFDASAVKPLKAFTTRHVACVLVIPATAYEQQAMCTQRSQVCQDSLRVLLRSHTTRCL